MTHQEQYRPTMCGFKIAQGKLGQQLWPALPRVLRLEGRRAQARKPVPLQSVSEEPALKLAPQRKGRTHLSKRLASHAENEWLRTAAPHPRRLAREGRTRIQFVVGQRGRCGAHRPGAAAHLDAPEFPSPDGAFAVGGQELNRRKTCFPASALRLPYAIPPGRPEGQEPTFASARTSGVLQSASRRVLGISVMARDLNLRLFFDQISTFSEF